MKINAHVGMKMVLLAVPDIIYLILSLNSKILLFKTSSFSETFRESLFSKIFVSGFNSASCVIDSYRSTTSADTKRTSLKIALILLLLLIKSLESLKSLILKPRLPTLVWDENLKTQRFFLRVFHIWKGWFSWDIKHCILKFNAIFSQDL